MSRTRLVQVFVLACVVGAGLAGSAAIVSASTAATAASAPVNQSPPTISGSAVPGDTLTASPGSWSGDTPISFAYQWERCDSSGGSCAAVSGATGQTYAVASADDGSTLRVAVTATNGAGSGYELSAPTAAVSSGAPVNTVAPTISGSLAVGDALTVAAGTWTGAQPIAISYQWERCDTSGGNCNWIGGATGASYTITSADAGSRLIVAVTAKNSVGSKQVVATAGNVGGSVPVETAAPTVSGALSVGSTLTVSSGSWSGAQPIAVSYQWERCDASGGNCNWISGATGANYQIGTADTGARLVVAVTAKNSDGTRQVVVTAGNVGGGGPAETAAPTVSGALTVGSTLTATAGTWSGTQPIAVSYQWERCDTSGGNCSWIGGATGASYKVGSADAGHRLVVAVTARNADGTKQAVVTAGNIGGTATAPSGSAIAVSAVSLPDRLVIDRIQLSPSPITTRAPITARFHVSDTNGHSVSGALVYVLGVPYGWTYNAPEQPTDGTGWATLVIRPTVKIPLRRGALLLFVRARKPGDSLLAGVSTRRLVQDRIR